MAHVVMVGGGVVGLSTAMMLAKDGHQVTVLERDAAPLPASVEEAWGSWDRKGVNQFRMGHFLLARSRSILDEELPEFVSALDSAGALRINPIADGAAMMPGGVQPGDERFEVITARRPIIELAVGRTISEMPEVKVRRGVAVRGLMHEPGNVPHVTGVVTDAGEEILGDLVIDCGGRRSSIPTMLEAIGAQRPAEEIADCGFVYFGRHFRSRDGSYPPMLGPALQPNGSISTLTLHADNATWSVILVGRSNDPAMRRLSDVGVWNTVVAAHPLVAPWVEAKPIDDAISVMAKIEDRVRHFVVAGRPVATGILPLSDASACTNPSVGRGITIGLMHGQALRDTLGELPVTDRVELAMRWHDVTEHRTMPYVRETLAFDRGRLAEMDAEINGDKFDPDPDFAFAKGLGAAAGKDGDCLRAVGDYGFLFKLAADLQRDKALVAKVQQLGTGSSASDLGLGPSRRQLMSMLATP